MGLGAISREKYWLVACAFVGVEAVLSFAVPHSYLLTTFGDSTQCVLLLIFLICAIANIRVTEQRTRLFWMLVALGAGIWFSVQILWTYFEVYLRRDVPNPFVGDVVLFLHLVPLMGALALQPDIERDQHGAHLGALDFVLLVTWWVYLYLFVVIPWQYVMPDANLYGRSFDIAYFLEHFVFLVVASTAWLRSSGGWKVVYGNLFGASLVYTLGSVAASTAIDLGKYYTGSYYDIPLVAAMAWFIATGLLARKMNLQTEPAKPAQNQLGVWLSGLAMVTVLTLPVLAGWALYISDAPAQVREFRLLLTLITMMLMGGLIWTKQHRMDKELARANQELREDSLTDQLTGSRNRRFLLSTIETDVRHTLRCYSSLANAQSKRNRDLVFYIIDADSFKEVNDRYGHDWGDQLLVEMARRISSAIRHSDALIRWGGDEFLVVSRYTDRDDAAALASRVLEAVANEPFELKGGISMQRTCTIGWAAFPWFVHDPETVKYADILQLADCALYQAKQAGKNQAIGMLPTRAEPAAGLGSTLGGRNDRLTEQLAAQTLVTPGPQNRKSDPAARLTAGKAAAATAKNS